MSLGVSVGGLALHVARGGSGALTPDHFTLPFLLVGFLSLMAVPIYLRLPRDVGATIGGRAAPAAEA